MSKQGITIRVEEKVRLLQRENDLLNSIIQGASDSIYSKDLDGRYITINEAGAAFLGLTVDGVIGKTDEEILGQEGVSIMQHDQQVFDTAESLTHDGHNTVGGKLRYFSTSKTPLLSSDGELIGLIGISRDITEKKIAEDKYRFIFDYAPIAFWEEDFTQVKAYFDQLAAAGVTDFRAHFQRNTDSLQECINRIKVLNINHSTLEMNGLTGDKNQLLSKLGQNFTPESESIFIDEFVALANGETEFESEGSFVNAAGEVLDVLFKLNVIPGHEEDLSLVLISVVDITSNKRLTTELNTIKHRYESIVEAQTEMICRIKPDGKIMFKNQAFIRFFKFKDSGNDSRFVSLFPPDELEKCLAEMDSLSPKNDTITVELRNYDGDGNLVWQEWSITAFYSNSGMLLGYQAVGADVTSRKMTQEALAASEARWRSVFDNADDLIMSVNSEGYVLSVNDYKQIPGSKKWAGRWLSEVLLPVNAEAVTELINEVFLTGKVIKTELKIVSPEGTSLIFGVAVSPILYGKRVISAVCIARNITETKAFENRNREALIEGEENERMRISQELHDGLGQLFTAIKLNLQHLKAGLHEQAPVEQLDERLKALEDHIGIAISEVKNISRNLMPDVLRQFGFKPAIEDLVEKWNSTLDNKIVLETIDLDSRFSQEGEKALFRICQELLNNSVRHGKPSKIYLQIINHGDSLVLMAEDDGVGFDPQKTSKGFGLRNIRSRAAVFDGILEIDSAPGKGTVTTIEIPLNKILNQ
mgnify:CR=1 FL=1